MADVSKFLAQIAKGDFDEAAVDIAKALKARDDEGAIQIRWRIDFDGLTIDQDNATVAEAMKFEEHTGFAFKHANPAVSTTRQVAVIVSALEARKQMSFEDATALLDTRTAAEIEACLSEYVAVHPPKDGGNPPI